MRNGTLISESFAHTHIPNERMVMTAAWTAVNSFTELSEPMLSEISLYANEPKNTVGIIKITPTAFEIRRAARLRR